MDTGIIDGLAKEPPVHWWFPTIKSKTRRCGSAPRGEEKMYIFDGKHYDSFFHLTEDFTMYKIFAEKYGKEILEIGIGTGRLAMELAKAGNNVTGIDFSQEMLSVGQKKAKENNIDIRFIQSDMRSFDTGNNYDLIIIPVNTITHLLTLDDIESFFGCVNRHLRENGRFVIDFLNPIIEYLPKEFGEEFSFNTYKLPEDGATMEVYAKSKYHRETQITEFRLSYRINNELVHNEILKMRMFFPQELDGYLRFNGFAIEEKYGDYDLSEFISTSPKQIIIAKVKTGNG